MEIIEKIIQLQKQKDGEIEMYKARIEEVKMKKMSNEKLLEEKIKIISAHFSQLNALKSKCMDTTDIQKSLERKNNRLNSKCENLANEINEKKSTFEEMSMIVESLQTHYIDLMNKREENIMKINGEKEKKQRNNDETKSELRGKLDDINKKCVELESIMRSMKSSVVSELKVKQIQASTQQKQYRKQIEDINVLNKELFNKLNLLEREKNSAVINARRELKNCSDEKKKCDASIREEYQLTISHLETKIHFLETNLRSLQNKYSSVKVVDSNPKIDNLCDSKEYVDSLDKRKAVYAMKLAKCQENIKKLRGIIVFLKKEEQKISARMQEFVSLNKADSDKWKEMSSEVDLYEKSKNDSIRKHEERTSAMRDKNINAKYILENLSLLINSLEAKYEQAQDTQSKVNACYVKYKTRNGALNDAVESINRKITQLRIEKRNIVIQAHPMVTAQFVVSPKKSVNESFNSDITIDDAQSNDSTHSLPDFDSFNSSLQTPLIEDLAPLDSIISSSNKRESVQSLGILNVRADIQEIKKALDSMLKDVDKKRNEIEEMKAEGSEYYALKEENMKLKKKQKNLIKMNEEIALIRSGKLTF